MSDNAANKQKEAPKGALPVEDPVTNVTLEESDVLDCALGFYLSSLADNPSRTSSDRQAVRQVASKTKDDLANFENYFTDRDYTSDKKTFITQKDFYKNFKENSLFLNSLFPKINLFKVFYKMGPNGTIESQESIPFDLQATWSKKWKTTI